MVTLSVVVLVAIGLLFIVSPYFVVGLGLLAAASFMWRFRTLEDEELLILVLAIFAFLGVVMLFIEDAIGRWLLS